MEILDEYNLGSTNHCQWKSMEAISPNNFTSVILSYSKFLQLNYILFTHSSVFEAHIRKLLRFYHPCTYSLEGVFAIISKHALSHTCLQVLCCQVMNVMTHLRFFCLHSFVNVGWLNPFFAINAQCHFEKKWHSHCQTKTSSQRECHQACNNGPKIASKKKRVKFFIYFSQLK